MMMMMMNEQSLMSILQQQNTGNHTVSHSVMKSSHNDTHRLMKNVSINFIWEITLPSTSEIQYSKSSHINIATGR